MRLGLKLSGAEATALSARFFRADRRLDGHVQFGFVLPEYRPRCGRPVRRLPTARAAVYYAADVKHGTTGRLTTGLFCEGPHSRGFDIASESGEIVGLKIRAGALQALLGVPAKELRDATLPMEELWGRSAAVVTEQLSAAPNPTARARILQSELIRRCQSFDRQDFIALTISQTIERRGGKVRVKELIQQSGFSQRMLLTKFDDWVGLTPKQQARLTRLRTAAVSLSKASSSHAEVALDCGYCDEPHMIHEFQDLLGLSPVKFLEQRFTFSPRGSEARGQRALPRREQELYRLLGQVSWHAAPLRTERRRF